MNTRRGVDLTGKTFGRLTAIEKVGRTRFGKIWKCNCECGKNIDAVSANLVSGNVRSCGCLRMENSLSGEKSIKHGEFAYGKKTSSEYSAWASIKARCYDKGNKAYHNYGGRGIKMCDRWLESFQNFIDDVGRKPSPAHSFDRYPDNNGNYEPGNVRWATFKEQQNNKRTNRVLVLNGISKSIKGWAEEYGIKYHVLRYGISKGKSLETMLSTNKN